MSEVEARLLNHAKVFEQDFLRRLALWPARYESALRESKKMTAEGLLAVSFPPRPAPYRSGCLDLVVWPMSSLERYATCSEYLPTEKGKELDKRLQVFRGEVKAFFVRLASSTVASHLSVCSMLLAYLRGAVGKYKEMFSRGLLFLYDPLFYSMPWDAFYDVVFCAKAFHEAWDDKRFLSAMVAGIDATLLSDINEMFVHGKEEEVSDWYDEIAMERAATIVEKSRHCLS